MPNMQEALSWFARGYNVVPQMAADRKHPGVKWKELQTRRVLLAELTRWSRRFGNGIGFITGQISGAIVVETDGPAGNALLAEYERHHGALPPTLTVRSGSGRGVHRHFKHPGFRVPTRANPSIKVDVKGDGGFCVLPPSVHKSGGTYDILLNVEPAPLPPQLLPFIEAAARSGVLAPDPKVIGSGLPPQPRPRISQSEPDTPRRRARLDAALAHVSADCSYNLYRDIVWALLGTEWFDAQEIARRWCMNAPERYQDESFAQIVSDFDAEVSQRPTLGTVFYLAREGGWDE